MITVKELQLKRVDTSNNALDEIEKRILAREEINYRELTYNLTGCVDAGYIISKLKEAGYAVKRQTGSDLHGDSWDYLNITWD